MTQKHTSLPWRTYNNFCEDDGRLIGIGCSGSDIAKVHTSQDIPTRHDVEALANAEFITRACNSHYELIEEIEKQIEWLKHAKDNVKASPNIIRGFEQSIKYLSLALKKARGE